MKKLIIISIIFIAMLMSHTACQSHNSKQENNMVEKINPNLTPDEERIILHKATEAPYSGKYNNFSEKGTFVCKNCRAELYSSDDKFNSHCGWPSFDDELPDAVKRVPDADGRRTEIVCKKCGGHLGHVFEGERLTKKNVRHCVNSLSIDFVPREIPATSHKAVFAAGCFWGVEALFRKLDGIESIKCGYIGGSVEDPTYEQVCKGNTGHLEAVEIFFNPEVVSYEELARYFFEIHDPTQANGQGPDIGEQYHSAIFYNTVEQKEIALKLIKILEDKGLKIATKLFKDTKFYEAEDYHQDYYTKKGTKPYCHFRRKIF